MLNTLLKRDLVHPTFDFVVMSEIGVADVSAVVALMNRQNRAQIT
ncbi:hypothetical protein [Bacterioplanoides sp.]